MSISIPQANKNLEAQVGKTAFGTQTAYVALSSTTPANGNPPTNITEPSTGSYARVTTSAATWNNASGGSISNAAVITFPAATADWSAGANLTYAVLYDALTLGNVIGWGVLAVPKGILSGDQMSIAAGQLTITLS